jgi:undecaprenyl-diphosphatase
MHTLIKLVAETFILIPVALISYEFFVLKPSLRRAFLLKLAGAAVLSLLLSRIASHFIHDPRPFVAGHFTPLIPHGADNGFPSDHTLFASFMAWLLLTYSRKLGIIALTVTALMGLARMAAGVHHSWDILGSFAITWVSVLVVSRLYVWYAANHK